jgi:hypothetical protein
MNGKKPSGPKIVMLTHPEKGGLEAHEFQFKGVHSGF